MRYISLFAGIGGMDLGFDRAGFTCVAQVEIDPYCRKILEKHWPEVPKYGDIKNVRGADLPECEVIAGGFPCQGLSNMGNMRGLSDSRSGLWGEQRRLVSEIRPKYVVVENVSALLGRGMSVVLGDLSEIGYDAEWRTLRASDFGLPHERERLFIVAYTNSPVRGKRMGVEQDRPGAVFPPGYPECEPVRVQAANRFIGMDDGVSGRAYRERAGALGNAIVPPAAQYIAQCIIHHSPK